MATPEEGTPELDVQTPADWQQEQQDQIDWEKRYKDLQAEFTKKTQEKPTYQQPNQEQEQQEFDVERAKQQLKNLWVVFGEQLESEKHFNGILEANPDLKQHADAIKAIAEAKNMAYEDVIETYKFMSSDKLRKAKERNLVWDRNIENKPKWVKDLSQKERDELQKSAKSNSFQMNRSF